jgi:uncharacterized glyoxalase superfamily metalloenzyme YdcJ
MASGEVVHATTGTTQLRAAFARRLSDLYGGEVPAYTTLVEVAHEVNAEVLAREGSAAERLGDIDRVTAERHGAIRVGTPAELAQVGRLFAAIGMHPVGCYDLRDAHPAPLPVVSTAFRPVDEDELAANPFRVFTSVLVPEDRRFFDADLGERVARFLVRRQLFPPELLDLADRAAAEGGLAGDDAERFLDLATASFALSSEPIDRGWYDELARMSGVAADIAGVGSTHVNHLTPRVLDIDLLYRRMQARGITMIDEIQGPPRWEGPDLLLRQTSFRALAEPRAMRDPDGTVAAGELRVRFGEVEARGIAVTPAGRELVDPLPADADAWAAAVPATERELARAGLAWFTAGPGPDAPDRTRSGGRPPADRVALVDDGWVRLEPVVYEDFLPRSAAGIFRSNLSEDGTADSSAAGVVRDTEWLSGALGRAVLDPMALYAAQVEASWDRTLAELGLPRVPA